MSNKSILEDIGHLEAGNEVEQTHCICLKEYKENEIT
jgi:hypothetical protein